MELHHVRSGGIGNVRSGERGNRGRPIRDVEKRGGGGPKVTLDELFVAAQTAAVPVEDLLTLEDALTRLEAIDPRGAQVVVLRFFSGLSVPEVAEHLGLSVRTVEGDWSHARAWLKREMAGSESQDPKA